MAYTFACISSFKTKGNQQAKVEEIRSAKKHNESHKKHVLEQLSNAKFNMIGIKKKTEFLKSLDCLKLGDLVFKIFCFPTLAHTCQFKLLFRNWPTNLSWSTVFNINLKSKRRNKVLTLSTIFYWESGCLFINSSQNKKMNAWDQIYRSFPGEALTFSRNPGPCRT